MAQLISATLLQILLVQEIAEKSIQVRGSKAGWQCPSSPLKNFFERC